VPEPKRVELTRKTEFVRKDPPKSLEIKPGDDSETRELKRKKLKTFKYKQRQQEISAEQNQKASSWQNFQAKSLKKGKKGIQKNSIFALPQDLTDAKGVGFAGSTPSARR
jgi:survival-of-motor-neuron-related-splicing factor 30